MNDTISQAIELVIFFNQNLAFDVAEYNHVCEYIALQATLGRSMDNIAFHTIVANARYLEYCIKHYYAKYITKSQEE